MKKSIGLNLSSFKVAVVILTTSLLGGCMADGSMSPNGTTANNIGMAVFRTAVDQKCRVELNNRTEYKVITRVLSSEKKQDIENQVCGCVGEEAAKNVTLVELTQAAIDPSSRAVLISNTVNNTISTCVSRFRF